MSEPGGEGQQVQQAIQALQHLLVQGSLPAGLPEALRTNPEFAALSGQIIAIHQFVQALANGNLDSELKQRGRMAGALKSLQANLRHITWQAQRIANGDLTQQVQFMGEFSAAFNQMVENLRQSRAALEQHAAELTQERQAALNLMLDAQAAHQEAEKANLLLQAQLTEIQNLQAALREQAIRDPLTGCFNRRYLQETLPRECARARREGYPLALIMLDIDHFKQVNDTYGHPAGDEMLRMLGGMLRASIRSGDMVCRYGGEEFLLVLPNVSGEVAVPRAEAIRAAFAQSSILHDQCTIQATVSLGVAVIENVDACCDELIKRADEALYAAKRTGRNRVVVYPP